MLPAERRLELEKNAARILRDALREITDDAEVIADTIQGETNLHETIHDALKSLMEDEILEAGIEKVVKELQGRLGRVQLKVEKKRLAILRAMAAGEVRKLTYPEATLSLRRVPPGLVVDDQRKIPKNYFEPQEPRLNRTALKDDLKSGKTVAGARLDNGSETLSLKKG